MFCGLTSVIDSVSSNSPLMNMTVEALSIFLLLKSVRNLSIGAFVLPLFFIIVNHKEYVIVSNIAFD